MIKLAITFFFFFCFSTNYYYVKPLASGLGNGNNWNDALGGFPKSRIRDSIYYFASGTYYFSSSVELNDLEDGEKVIEFRKATTSDHGTETGFESSLIQGQVIFSVNFTGSSWAQMNFYIRRSYYTFNGGDFSGEDIVTGKRGIKMEISKWACKNNNLKSGFQNLIIQSFDYKTDYHWLHFNNVEFGLCGPRSYFASDDSIFMVSQQIINDFQLTNSYIHDAGRSAVVISGKNLYFNKNYLENIGGNEEVMGLRFDGSCSYITIKNSVFQNVEYENVMFRGNSQNIYIYNNIFLHTNDRPYFVYAATNAIYCEAKCDYIDVIQNDFINFRGLGAGITFTSGTNGRVYNNIFAFNLVSSFHLSGTADYNTFCNNFRDMGQYGEYYLALDDSNAIHSNDYSCHNNISINPFVRYSNGMLYRQSDLHPSSSSPSAYIFTSTDRFSRDMFSTPRISGGPRGALIYAGDCPSSTSCSSSQATPQNCLLAPVCNVNNGSCLQSMKSSDGTLCGDSSTIVNACVDGKCSSGVCAGVPDVGFRRFYDCDYKKSGEFCHYECYLNHVPGTIQCLNGKWQTPSVNCSSYCSKIPNVPNTYYDTSYRANFEYSENTVVMYCSSNMQQLIIKCENDIWLDETYGASCPEWICKTNPSFSGYKMIDECSGYKASETCTNIACTYGGSILTYPICQSDGSWSTPTGCISSEPSCHATIKNCMRCSSETTCGLCDFGYNGTNCQPIDCQIENCYSCESTWTCATCENGYLLSEYGLSCDSSCSSITNCTLCEDSFCKSCSDFSVLFPPKCQTNCGNSMNINCTECSASGICLECAFGLTPINSGKTCQYLAEPTDFVLFDPSALIVGILSFLITSFFFVITVFFIVLFSFLSFKKINSETKSKKTKK